jgi:VCBS repeat-containing protein
VLSNDTDEDGDLLSVHLVSDPAHGTLTLNVDGSFDYMPATNYAGQDSFTYRAVDGELASNVATVSITVSQTNSAPVAIDDSYSVIANTILTVAAPGVLRNDTDADGNTLKAILVRRPAHGMLMLNAGGSFVYKPVRYYAGPDSFAYKVNDGQAGSNIATVSISIQYRFIGFFQPVDNPGPGPRYIFNTVKAGSAVPVRFSLAGYQGLSIFAPGYPTSTPVKCTTAARFDLIEQTVTAGNSSLSYNPASNTYIYAWKTEKKWAGTCRVLTVQFRDGTQRLAYFLFK